MNEEPIDQKKLAKHFGQVGQILDGLWFVELEKRYGFDVAYAIDEAVWTTFSKKEGKRLCALFNITTPTLENIEKILKYSIFNQSLKFELKKQSDAPLVLHFNVIECKTYEGMCKINRADQQVGQICEGIGLVFFRNLLSVVDPNVQIKCLSCPKDKKLQGSPVCVWEFRFS